MEATSWQLQNKCSTNHVSFFQVFFFVRNFKYHAYVHETTKQKHIPVRGEFPTHTQSHNCNFEVTLKLILTLLESHSKS